MSDGVSTVEVGSRPLRIEDVVAVARQGARVRLAPEVGTRIARARQVVDRLAASGSPVYGLTTGLGAAVDTPLGPDELVAFQARAVLARAVGIGERFSTGEVRAALFARLVGLARGASGIGQGFAEALGLMLDRGVHPLARRTGSLGEADLAPLAGLFLVFAGEGDAEYGGRILPGPEAFREAGIAPPALGPKDGIALINANACSTGLGALALHDTGLALEAAFAAAALSLEAFRANLSVIDPALVALRPAPGQARGSERLRTLLAGSDLFEEDAARRVQDPLSFRCAAPVLGFALLRQDEARLAIETELNGAGDSPAVLAEAGVVASSVNFDTTATALSLEALGQAAAHAAAIAVFRIAKLMSPALSGLPRFLARRGGTRSGFATSQKTAAALEAEIRHLALPLGPMTAPVADGVEDYAPMTLRIVEKTHAIALRLAALAAIELVVAAAACDLRAGIRLGAGTARAHAWLRGEVAPFDEDRATGEEFERVAAAILSGGFSLEAR